MLNAQEIKKTAQQTVFKKGLKSWWSLVTVCFIFSFIGVTNNAQASIVDAIDGFLGLDNPYLTNNVEMLKKFVLDSNIVNKIPLLNDKWLVLILDSISKSSTWLIKILSLNMAYINRNKKEVIVLMTISAILTTLFHFFFRNAALVGENRYVMENRFAKEIKIRRIMAPFHRKYFFNIIYVSFRTYLKVFLWFFTIIGGFIKMYEYSMVPFILAENPAIEYKSAIKLSSQMTLGYKWQIAKIQLSWFYIYLLKIVPVIGLLVSLPLENQLNAEIYFNLRKRDDIDHTYFIEDNFHLDAYINSNKENKEYKLKDLVNDIHYEKRTNYTIYELILMFFLFSFIGWLWEEILFIVKYHVLVNRGTLYGPWLPIYGVGGVSIIILLDRYKKNPWQCFLMAMLICGIIEYAGSLFLDFVYNTSYWDYEQELFNLNGRICLSGLLAFGIGGMFGMYIIAPKFVEFLKPVSKNKQLILCIILISLFLSDNLAVKIIGLNGGSDVSKQLS